LKLALKSAGRLLLALLMSLLVGCADRAEPETFLIEKGYRGKINVIFNQPNGQAEKYENGHRIYEIPRNGILLTRFKDDYGLIDQQYFLVDASGKREALKELDVRSFNEEWTTTKNSIEPSRDEFGVFFAGRVGVYGNSDDPKSLRFREFFVSAYRELKTYHDQKYDEEFLERIKKLTGVLF
jgi:hypothetical protein